MLKLQAQAGTCISMKHGLSLSRHTEFPALFGRSCWGLGTCEEFRQVNTALLVGLRSDLHDTTSHIGTASSTHTHYKVLSGVQAEPSSASLNRTNTSKTIDADQWMGVC